LYLDLIGEPNIPPKSFDSAFMASSEEAAAVKGSNPDPTPVVDSKRGEYTPSRCSHLSKKSVVEIIYRNHA